MVTYEEARKKAVELKPNTDWCNEFENGYMFTALEDENYTGGYGHTPVVVLKETGEVIPMNEFVIQGTGELIKEAAINDY